MTSLIAAGLLVAGCGDQSSRVATEPQAQTAAPDGAVTTAHPVMVIDGGDGAELCLGGVQESLPPQCSGPELLGWDWADHDGHSESSGGVRWGAFVVTGTFDGSDLTVTDAVAASAWNGPGPATDAVDFSSPCPEPPGGWPSEPRRVLAHQTVLEAAQRRPDYAGAWLTQRDPRDPSELDQELADDPEAEVQPPIVNIKVTGDREAAEAELTRVWDGPLCVVAAERTEDELRTIQDELTTGTSGLVSSGVDTMAGTVHLTVTYDDGTLQAELDERYGEGVVEVESALVPADLVPDE